MASATSAAVRRERQEGAQGLAHGTNELGLVWRTCRGASSTEGGGAPEGSCEWPPASPDACAAAGASSQVFQLKLWRGAAVQAGLLLLMSLRKFGALLEMKQRFWQRQACRVTKSPTVAY